MAIIYLAAGNVLPLFDHTEAARPSNSKLEVPSSTLTLSQSVTCKIRPLRLSVSSSLSFQQKSNWNPKKISVGNTLGLFQGTSKVPPQHLYDFITFTQLARTVKHELVASVIALTQTVGYSRGFDQLLVFMDFVEYTLVSHLDLVDVLELEQGVAVFKANDPNFVVGAPAPVPQPLNISLTLGTTTIVLPPPEFDDKNEINHHRINRRTRAGELIIYKDPMWPIIETLSFHFTGLSELKIKSLLDFINATLGRTIGLVDYRGVHWNVIVTNPEAQATQDSGRSPCDKFSIELEFEGTRA